MADNEKDVERRVDRLETKFDMFIEEMREFKTEMRQQNQMRAEELRELQRKHETDMRELQKRQDEDRRKHDADMKELQKRQDEDRRRHEEDMRAINTKIDSKFDKLSDQLHTMTIAAVVGFGAIAAAVGGLVFAAFR